jgi:uncharacterized membrane protein
MKKYILLTLLLCLMSLSLFASSGFREHTIDWLSQRGISPEWIVIIISVLPVIELRGAIPVGIFLFGFTWWKATLLSVIGNMIPIPLVLLFMDGVVAGIRKVKAGRQFTDWLFARTRKKGKMLENSKAIGLAVFVGIPLPGTGAWTGAFAANIFGFKFWKSMWYIFLGVLMAAAAVATLCQMGIIVLG